jgi:hypothetical protein
MGRTQSADTAESIERRLMARYRTMAPWEKLHIVSELSKASYDLAAAGIRLRRPESSDDDIRLILAVRRLGAETVRRATGRASLPFDE